MVAFILSASRQQSGQGMTEYAIVAAALVAGAITTNSLIIPALNDLYELVTCMLSIPFP
jgi:hypothetical protein